MISSSQRHLPDNSQNSQQTNIHAPDGIRTHMRRAADLHLKPHGHWNRHNILFCIFNMKRFCHYAYSFTFPKKYFTFLQQHSTNVIFHKITTFEKNFQLKFNEEFLPQWIRSSHASLIRTNSYEIKKLKRNILWSSTSDNFFRCCMSPVNPFTNIGLSFLPLVHRYEMSITVSTNDYNENIFTAVHFYSSRFT